MANQMQNCQVQLDGGGSASADDTIAPGRIAIEASVDVSFLLGDGR